MSFVIDLDRGNQIVILKGRKLNLFPIPFLNALIIAFRFYCTERSSQQIVTAFDRKKMILAIKTKNFNVNFRWSQANLIGN